MRFSQFKGIDPKLGQLLRSIRNGTSMHAMLFDGPKGTGKRTMADVLSRAALCASDGERPCDVCPTCRKCIDNVHPDVHIVDLEEDRKQIRIEQIRALIEQLSLASYEGGKKIVIIENADCMNANAQNALLKTLEEPVGDTLFFLLTVSPGALLQTIRSRCLPVHFSALGVEECAQVLINRGLDSAKSKEFSALAAGCVGRALDIANDQNYPKLRESVLSAIETIRKAEDVPKAVSIIGKIKDSAMGNDVLDIIELWAWDLMRVQNGADPLEINDLSKLEKSKINGNKLLRIVAEARQNRNVNVGWSNLLEPLLYRIAEQVNSEK